VIRLYWLYTHLPVKCNNVCIIRLVTHQRKIDGIKSWNCRQGTGVKSWPAEYQYISQTPNIVHLLELCLLLALFIKEIHAKKRIGSTPRKSDPSAQLSAGNTSCLLKTFPTLAICSPVVTVNEKEMHNKYWSENLKGRYHVEDLRTSCRILFKRTLKN
jgi:hypothetical protein